MSSSAHREADLLAAALIAPRTVVTTSLPDWDILIRQARSANLLARLATDLRDQDLLHRVPAAARAHLEGALIYARAQRTAVKREVSFIVQALAPLRVPIVLLKGAAYLFAALPAARGRLFSDIDILVPKLALAEVEAALMLHGWATTHHDPYDQRYYRRWMHELPPMQHVKRMTVLDVHHAILPITARLKPSSTTLLAESVSLREEPELRVLAPRDMVLHSAAHLYHNDDLTHALRDLADIDALLREFARDAAFWSSLASRAAELDLVDPLAFGLKFTHRIFGTAVPDEVLCGFKRSTPVSLLERGLDQLWLRALRPRHHTADDWLSPVARSILYLRAHWLRMPPLLLAYHLSVKAMRRAATGERAH